MIGWGLVGVLILGVISIILEIVTDSRPEPPHVRRDWNDNKEKY